MKTIDHKKYTRLFNDWQKATYEYREILIQYDNHVVEYDLVAGYALQLKIATYFYKEFKLKNDIKWGIWKWA